jgi:alkanesulfonate monooxygenase SsuD/methylene tetrahydromethanopterin reductase-like flavin-dependent oxidoreductase (luciferase family)
LRALDVRTDPTFGYLLPTRGFVFKAGKSDFADLLSLAKLAESSGFDSLWVGDSIIAKPRFEPFTTLSAVAAVCGKATLGTAVLLPALRQPVVLAHSITTLDTIARGRLILGVGTGGPFDIYKHEFASCGIPFGKRISRTDETIKVIRLLLGQDHVNFSGSTCNLEDVTLEPRPFTKGGPKILMSAGAPLTDAAVKRIVTFSDGWMTAEVFPNEYKDGWTRIRNASGDRDMIPSLYMTININVDQASAKKETADYLSRYYGGTPPLDRWGPFGEPQEVARALKSFIEAGARMFSIRFASFDQEKQISLFTAKVLPIIKS